MKKIKTTREIMDSLDDIELSLIRESLNDVMRSLDATIFQLEKEEGLPVLVNTSPMLIDASPELRLAREKLWNISLKNSEIASGKVLAIPTETHCGLCGGEHGSDISNNDDKYRCRTCKCTIKKTGMSIYREDIGSIFWFEGVGYIQN